MVQVLVGERSGPAGEAAVLLEANVDDVTGEVLAHTIAALLAAGAADAWVTPIVMKKGRPAHTVSALADPLVGPGARGRPDRRDRHPRRAGRARGRSGPQPREVTTVEVEGHAIRVKVTPGGRHKVEFDDAAAAAAALGRPVRESSSRAEAAAAAR